MLTEAGIELREEKYNTDMVYLSRFYRLLPGVTEPDKQVFVGGAIGYGGYAVFRGDNTAFSITMALGTEDTELRALIDEERFDVAMMMLPAAQRWINKDTAEPIGKMHAMADLINRSRDLVVDGRPAVLGFTAVGDALICTNPLYGRGCSLGGVHARLLTSAVGEHGSDLEAMALQLHDDVQREIIPWYKASVTQDDVARAMRESAGGPANPNDPASIFTEGLLPLTRVDAYAHRAFSRMMNLLSPPDSLFADEELMKRAMAFWLKRDERPPEPPMGPPREEMIAVLQAAGA
jgi:2-polyprenyl-6-methoxyphenol hydroxylase-like FAD-dependent oxidoreductase